MNSSLLRDAFQNIEHLSWHGPDQSEHCDQPQWLVVKYGHSYTSRYQLNVNPASEKGLYQEASPAAGAL